MANSSNKIPTTASKTIAAKIGILVFTLVFVLLTYTFLHEGGHALMGLLFGGTLTSFSVNFINFSAHVGIDGNFSLLQRSLISVAGISLPLLIWAVWIARTPIHNNPLLEWVKTISTLGVLNTLLAWIIIPFLYMAGNIPSDDSATFLSLTKFHPALVAGLALLIYLAGWILFLSRVEGFRGLVQRLRDSLGDTPLQNSRRTLLTMMVVFLCISTASVALTLTTQGSLPDLSVPADYSLAIDVDCSQKAYQDETVYRINLPKSANVSLFFQLKDISKGPFEISLVDPPGVKRVFLKGDKDFDAGLATVNPLEMSLPAGSYFIHLTVPQVSGSIGIYTRVNPAQ